MVLLFTPLTVACTIALYEPWVTSHRGDWELARSLAEVHVDVAETLPDMAAVRGAPRQDLMRRTAAEYEKAHAIYVGLRDSGVLPAADRAHVDELAELAAKFTRAAQ
jgi:hypothetical protein